MGIDDRRDMAKKPKYVYPIIGKHGAIKGNESTVKPKDNIKIKNDTPQPATVSSINVATRQPVEMQSSEPKVIYGNNIKTQFDCHTNIFNITANVPSTS